MKKISQEEDKAYKTFTEFMKEVLYHADTINNLDNNTPESIFIKDKALKDLSELLFRNYNWSNALSKKEMENIYKQKSN